MNVLCRLLRYALLFTSNRDMWRNRWRLSRKRAADLSAQLVRQEEDIEALELRVASLKGDLVLARRYLRQANKGAERNAMCARIACQQLTIRALQGRPPVTVLVADSGEKCR